MNTEPTRATQARPETLPEPPPGLAWAIGESGGWELCPIEETVEIPVLGSVA